MGRRVDLLDFMNWVELSPAGVLLLLLPLLLLLVLVLVLLLLLLLLLRLLPHFFFHARKEASRVPSGAPPHHGHDRRWCM